MGRLGGGALRRRGRGRAPAAPPRHPQAGHRPGCARFSGPFPTPALNEVCGICGITNPEKRKTAGEGFAG